jgi:hypothetical protein
VRSPLRAAVLLALFAALAGAAAGCTPTTTGGAPTVADPPSAGRRGSGPPSTVAMTTAPVAGSTTSTAGPPAPDAGTPTTFATTPRSLPPAPESDTEARLLEGRRLADAMPAPSLVEPRYLTGGPHTVPLAGAPELARWLVFDAPTPAVAQQRGMVTGFVSSRYTADGASSIELGAFEFPDAAHAAAAVRPLADSVRATYFTEQPAQLAGHPGAVGWTGHNDGVGYQLQIFQAQGAVVLWVSTADRFQPTDQAGRAVRLLDAMVAAYSGFRATPAAELRRLPTDQDGLVAHTVPNTGVDRSVRDGLYTAAGELHFDTDPVTTRELFRRAGVDLVSLAATGVYRARDAAGAAIVRDGFVQEAQQQDAAAHPATVDGAPTGTSCLRYPTDPTYYCVSVDGRYAVDASSDSATLIGRLLTAQAVLLRGR